MIVVCYDKRGTTKGVVNIFYAGASALDIVRRRGLTWLRLKDEGTERPFGNIAIG